MKRIVMTFACLTGLMILACGQPAAAQTGAASYPSPLCSAAAQGTSLTGQIEGAPYSGGFRLRSGGRLLAVSYTGAVPICERGSSVPTSALVSGTTVTVTGQMFQQNGTQIIARRIGILRQTSAQSPQTSAASGQQAGAQSQLPQNAGGASSTGAAQNSAGTSPQQAGSVHGGYTYGSRSPGSGVAPASQAEIMICSTLEVIPINSSGVSGSDASAEAFQVHCTTAVGEDLSILKSLLNHREIPLSLLFSRDGTRLAPESSEKWKAGGTIYLGGGTDTQKGAAMAEVYVDKAKIVRLELSGQGSGTSLDFTVSSSQVEILTEGQVK